MRLLIAVFSGQPTCAGADSLLTMAYALANPSALAIALSCGPKSTELSRTVAVSSAAAGQYSVQAIASASLCGISTAAVGLLVNGTKLPRDERTTMSFAYVCAQTTSSTLSTSTPSAQGLNPCSGWVLITTTIVNVSMDPGPVYVMIGGHVCAVLLPASPIDPSANTSKLGAQAPELPALAGTLLLCFNSATSNLSTTFEFFVCEAGYTPAPVAFPP